MIPKQMSSAKALQMIITSKVTTTHDGYRGLKESICSGGACKILQAVSQKKAQIRWSFGSAFWIIQW